MPGESVFGHWFRATVRGAVGALVFVLPLVPGPAASALTGPGVSHGGAIEVLPPASTGRTQSAGLFATACTAPGTCVAGGEYQAAGQPVEPVVAAQTRGRWSRGTGIVLPANAARQPYAEVNGIACVSTGNCVAVGDYQYGGSNSLQAFIATESNGRWSRATAPRLPADSSAPASAQLDAVSCLRSGFCTAVGTYQDSSGNVQAMAIARLPGGTWRPAAGIDSPASAASNPDAFVEGISCAGTGSCVAVGQYRVAEGRFAAMGAVETGGTWHRAAEIAAPRNAIPSTFTAIGSISCPQAGSCTGVGEYAISATQSRAMSVTESNGRFSAATEITAVPANSSPHPSTYLLGVSCMTAGTCLAVGGGRDRTGHSAGMYMTLVRGHWTAAFVPPPRLAGTGSRELSALYSVSCAGRAGCTAVGYYHDRSGALHAEAVSAG